MARADVDKFILIWIIAMVLVALIGDVSLAATDVGRSAADFLMIGHGARAAALGGAYTAMASEATAAYWNPAGLTEIENAEVTLGHYAWFQDITVEQASLAFPLSERFFGAVSATYLNYGTIQGYDISGLPSDEISAYDLVGGISLGYAVTEQISFGLTGKYISQRLDDITASAFAGDIGLRYCAESFALGATLVNLGSDMKFDQVSETLPTAARFGVMFRPFSEALAASLDVEQRIHGDLYVRQGLELGFDERYFLRAGLDYLPAQDGRRLSTGLSAGAGLRLSFAEFDYAFTPNDKSTSEDLHRFTLTFLFGPR
jgi:hypothetical protein